MKTPHTAQRFAKTYAQFMPPAWVSWCGVVLLILSTLAASSVAYFHDTYSSILNIRELALTRRKTTSAGPATASTTPTN